MQIVMEDPTALLEIKGIHSMQIRQVNQEFTMMSTSLALKRKSFTETLSCISSTA